MATKFDKQTSVVPSLIQMDYVTILESLERVPRVYPYSCIFLYAQTIAYN